MKEIAITDELRIRDAEDADSETVRTITRRGAAGIRIAA